MFPTPTVVPFTTTTRLSSGTACVCAERTYTGWTHRNASFSGITSRSPNCTVDPPWSSSDRSAENCGFWLIREKICAGPSTLAPDGNVKATVCP